MPVLEDFSKALRFFDTLKRENLIKDYAIIGGLALSAWIKPRATKDIDLIVSCAADFEHADLKYLVESRLGKKTVTHIMRNAENINMSRSGHNYPIVRIIRRLTDREWLSVNSYFIPMLGIQFLCAFRTYPVAEFSLGTGAYI
jgi:hypothetical protein